MERRIVRPLAGALAAALLLTACATGGAPAPDGAAETPLPGDPTDEPLPTPSPSPSASETRTPPAVDAALSEVAAGDTPLTSLAVMHHGELLGAAYGPGLDARTPQPVWSVTKSVVSVLTGIAVDEGLLRLDTPLTELLGDAAARHPGLTVEHLLTMRSGLGLADTELGFVQLYRSDDWVTAILDREAEHPPGEVFAYCSACVHLLTAALDEVTGGLAAFADDRLFGPLGFGEVAWERANDGTDVPIGGWGLALTVEELARLGQLFLDGGVWEGRSLVPADWVAASTADQVDVGAAFEDWQVGYGYLWWVHGTGAYAATGRGGQLVVVVPGSDLVVATTADLSDAEAFRAFAFVWTRVVAAIPVGER